MCPEQTPGCSSRDEFRDKLRAAVVTLMDSMQLDALVYPTWSNPPRLDRRSEHAGRRQQPAVLADAPDFRRSPCRWAIRAAARCRRGCSSRPRLERADALGLAYAYEQATHHRRAPPSLR